MPAFVKMHHYMLFHLKIISVCDKSQVKLDFRFVCLCDSDVWLTFLGPVMAYACIAHI